MIDVVLGLRWLCWQLKQTELESILWFQNEEPESGREGLEALVEKRRERRAWEERRNTLMFNYTQFSYYGKPVSATMSGNIWSKNKLMYCGSAVTNFLIK